MREVRLFEKVWKVLLTSVSNSIGLAASALGLRLMSGVSAPLPIQGEKRSDCTRSGKL